MSVHLSSNSEDERVRIITKTFYM